MRDISLIRSFIGRHWKSIAFGSFFVVLTNLLHVFLPSFIGRAVDLLASDFSFRALYSICAVILLVEFAKGVSRFLMRYIIIGASWKIENDIRERLFNHLLKLPVAYYNKTRTGDIIARISNDLTAARMLFGPALMYLMNAIVLLPLVILFMLSRDVWLTVYAVIPFPFIAVIMYVLGKKIHRHFIKVQESYSDISAHVQENLNGIKIIKAFVKERSELNKLKNLSRKYVDYNRKIIHLQSMMFPLMDTFASAGIIILIWVGGRKILAGETSIGVVIALIMYIGQLIWPAIVLGWVTALYQRGLASTKRIQEILDEKPEPQDTSDLRRLRGNISIRNLNFSYNTNIPVLSGISFDVQAGSTIGVAGRTGSGKSTLLGVLGGNYEAKRGCVFYDNVDIRDIPLSSLRSSIAFASQETFLFSDSILENISLGRQDADREAVLQAAVLASIAEEIEMFPHGYDTVLGERGVTVSGGQRQRIAIARALISEAPIIFFDDSLSNVDTATEKIILENLKQITEDKTAIIVTQRLASIRDTDEILYLKDGKIYERGTHKTLMKLDGEYAALYREQESIEALEDTDRL